MGQSAVRSLFLRDQQGALHLEHWGVSSGDIEVTGIPIDPAFSVPADRAACLQRHQILGDRPVVLQLCGGFGVGPVEVVFHSLLEVKRPMDLVVVCGRNAKLKTRLASLPAAAPSRPYSGLHARDRPTDGLRRHRRYETRWVDQFRSIARGLVMVIVNPIPGQESCNSDYLLENGAAVKANHPSTLSRKVSQLLEQPAELAKRRQAALAIGRPRAAFDVIRRSMELIGVTC